MLEDCALVLFALGEIMYSCGCPIDVDAILWAKQEITYQQQGTPMLPTSWSTLRNTSCIRWPCRVLETATFHMQAKTLMH